MTFVEQLGLNVWLDLHSAAEYGNISYCISMIDDIKTHYPCQMCRQHFVQNLHQVDDYSGFKTLLDMKTWLYNVHNIVNVMKNKQCPSMNILKQYKKPLYSQRWKQFQHLPYQTQLEQHYQSLINTKLHLNSLNTLTTVSSQHTSLGYHNKIPPLNLVPDIMLYGSHNCNHYLK